MKEKDRQVLPSLNGDADLPERLWLYDEFTAEEDLPATDYGAGLASLGFIGAALRRSKWLWCGAAALGLICGVGLDVKSPPAYEAQTTVLITHSANDNPVDAMQTDATLAESRTVAERALAKLGESENVTSFLAAETVTPVTDRVLLIKVSATSSREAVRRADALAAVFLKFRAAELQTQQQLTVASLNQQISQATQHISSISAQISQVSGQASSGAQRAQLSRLNSQRTEAENALNVLQQTTAGDQASGQATVTSEVTGSAVLDAAMPIHHSRLKYALIYGLAGLFAGLVIGLAFVIVRALVSDRLRRRDDIADALGTPVGLSTGPLAGPRWLPSWPRPGSSRAKAVERAAMHLYDAVPRSSSGPAALAVVAVDNDRTVAQVMVVLATAIARGGEKVIVTDLCPGAPAARQLGARSPGLTKVSLDGTTLGVAVPAEGDLMPIGPVGGSQAEVPAADGAYESAEVLLTLISLDPSAGAENLPTWASDAVVVVTAGRSSWLRLRAVGEMIRLSGTTAGPAILTGADQADESLGTGHPDPARPAASPLGGF